MRHHTRTPKEYHPSTAPTNHRLVIKTLWQYLSVWRYRMFFALTCLVLAKLANVGIPIVLKEIVDHAAPLLNQPSNVTYVLPFLLVALYGFLRLSTSVFTELRQIIFARVTQGSIRKVALQVFAHLHQLSLRFHLDRQTGGVARDIERGTRALSSLVSYTLHSILPTILEVILVLVYLLLNCDIWFVVIVMTALTMYVLFTISVTEWRTKYRRSMNDLDSKANVQAIDALINYETVKYFGNEKFETTRYDESLARWEAVAIKSEMSLSFLNVGQSLIIAGAVTAMLWRAVALVSQGAMSIGDLVLVNGFMLQLYMPLNFLGVLYREIRQALSDLDRFFGLLKQESEVQDAVDATTYLPNGSSITFEHVSFSYDSNRAILHDISFVVPSGKTLAIVGHSGAGKSTIARLLFRFYDVTGGAIKIDGQDIRTLTQSSLRAAIGIVPQDCVLFNDTIRYNIAYGNPMCTMDDIVEVAKAAHIHDFILSLPNQYETNVGERGLKLSGGEKQRVAIARALLKQPSVFVFDEATSALDSHAEQMIQRQMAELSQTKTSIMIAHRLSTITHADQILVFDQGRIVECGTHTTLLAQQGQYAQMWALQQVADSDIKH